LAHITPSHPLPVVLASGQWRLRGDVIGDLR
jgi:hypothetical protein